VENNDGRFISTQHSKTDSSDFERKNYGQLKLGYEYNTLDNGLFPRRGLKFISGILYSRNLEESDKDFFNSLQKPVFIILKDVLHWQIG
jgi:outer membrane translocation and assembly module TamA